MSNDAAILAASILPLCGKCRICDCGGDECSVGGGERCCWVDALKTLCSNPRCLIVAARRRQQEKRDKERTAAIPQWYRGKRKPEMSRKRRSKKAKGRAA